MQNYSSKCRRQYHMSNLSVTQLCYLERRPLATTPRQPFTCAWAHPRSPTGVRPCACKRRRRSCRRSLCSGGSTRGGPRGGGEKMRQGRRRGKERNGKQGLGGQIGSGGYWKSMKPLLCPPPASASRLLPFFQLPSPRRLPNLAHLAPLPIIANSCVLLILSSPPLRSQAAHHLLPSSAH